MGPWRYALKWYVNCTLCMVPISASDWLVHWQFKTRTGAFDCVNYQQIKSYPCDSIKGNTAYYIGPATRAEEYVGDLFLHACDRWTNCQEKIHFMGSKQCAIVHQDEGHKVRTRNYSHVNLIKDQVMIAYRLISHSFPSETSWRQLLQEDVIFTVVEVHGAKWNTASMRPWWVGI